MINASIKYFLILFSFVTLSLEGALAQAVSLVEPSSLRIGIRIGGNSVLPLESVENATYYPTVSYQGGLVLGIGRGRVSFQPELNYTQRTVRADYTSQGVSLSAKAFTNRIEVPLLAKATFGNTDSKARFFVNLGPYGAYVLNERYRADLLSLDLSYISNAQLRAAAEQAIRSQVNTLNNSKAAFDGAKGRLSYGAAGGLGVVIKAGPGQLTLEGRALYELGNNASAMSDPSGAGVASSIRDTKYALLQASVGYSIPLGRQ